MSSLIIYLFFYFLNRMAICCMCLRVEHTMINRNRKGIPICITKELLIDVLYPISSRPYRTNDIFAW